MLFKRNVRVEIYDPAGGVHIVEKPIHIGFNVELRSGSKPDEGEIHIYNLAPSTREKLQNESTAVRLFAGYGDGTPPKLFEGAAVNIRSNPDGNTDFRTTIRAADGFAEMSGTYYSRTFPAGSPFVDIVRDVVTALGFPAELDPAAVKGTLLRSRSFDGRADKILDTLAAEVGFEWSVKFGIAVIKKPGTVDKSDPSVLVVGPDSGLVGSPVVKYERAGGEIRRRITASLMLLPGIRPGRLIQIKSTRFTVDEEPGRGKDPGDITAAGVYLIDKTTLTGDNYGGEYTAEVSGYANR